MQRGIYRAVVCALVVGIGCGDNNPARDDAGTADDGGAEDAETDAPAVNGDAPSDGTGDTEAPAWPSAALRGAPTGAATAQLTWTAATDNVAVTGYHVYSGSTLVADLPATALAYDASSLVIGTEYAYRVEASDAADNTSQNGPRFVYVPPPLDPSLSATTHDPTIVTGFASSTEFLYTGTGAVQTGVATGTIDPERVVVLRGRVTEADGTPLAGVTVTIPGDPQYGTTLSRADGWFDFATNGGGVITVRYRRPGYIEVDRQVRTQWNEFDTLPTVVMTAFDTKVTEVDLPNLTTIAVAHSSVISDMHAARHVAMMFTPGTTATMKMPDGSTQPLTMMHVRATEFTVGDNGPAAMPAELPNGSAYTQCVELSVDEAVSAGATSVQFSQPVAFYIENFLDYAVGSTVPLGSYDRERLKWIAMTDGVVLEILSVTAGKADLDLDGSGTAADAAALTALGITDAERTALAVDYTVGAKLWRLSTTHFSPKDPNYSFVFPSPAPTPPPGPAPVPPKPPRQPECPNAGSIIDCHRQGLREEIPITGTPFSLWYSSDWATSSAVGFDVPLTDASPNPSLRQVRLRIEVAGTVTEATYAPSASISVPFSWDGKDAYGREVYGSTTARVRVSYMYQPARVVPLRIPNGPPTFARDLGGFLVTGTGVVMPDTGGALWYQTFTSTDVPLYRTPKREQAGWHISAHHVWDPRESRLFAGTGEDWSTPLLGPVFDQPPNGGSVGNPMGITVTPSGSTITAGAGGIGGSWAYKLNPDGTGAFFAGKFGNTGFCGDGGLATLACVNTVIGVAQAPNGDVFIVDAGNSRIRKVDRNGIITTFAGTGTSGYTGDGGPATSANIALSYQNLTPLQVGVARDGTVYIPDRTNHVIRRVLPDGIIDTFAGTGSSGFSGDGGSARLAQLAAPTSVVVGEDDSVYIGDTYNYRVRRVGPDGIITTVAGGGTTVADSGLATDIKLVFVGGLAVARDGGLYITETYRIRLLKPSGELVTFAGGVDQTAAGAWPPLGSPAKASELGGTFGVAVGPEGSPWVARHSSGIARMSSAKNRLAPGELVVPSPDGAEVYVFNSSGRHLRTVDPLSGAPRLTFGYDIAGRLVTITDHHGNETTLNRDADGLLTSIVAPGGATTQVDMGITGQVQSVEDPMGAFTLLSYDDAGRLETFSRPGRGTSTFVYDMTGRLLDDVNSLTGTQTLRRNSRVRESDPDIITHTTAAGRATTYATTDTEDKKHIYTVSSGDRTITRTVDGAITTTVRDDGATWRAVTRPAPRWGMLAPYVSSLRETLPSAAQTEATSTMSVNLSDPTDIFSVTGASRSVTVAGETTSLAIAPGSTWTHTYTLPSGKRRVFQLSPAGDLLGYNVDDSFAGFTFSLDTDGHLDGHAQGGAAWTYVNNSAGKPVSITDATSRTTLYQWNANGHVTQKELPSGRTIDISRNPAGDITGVKMPSTLTHAYTYDTAGRMTSYTPPGGFTSTYTYNDDGAPLSRVAASNRTLAYTHDADKRVTELDDTRASNTITYVGASERVSSFAWQAGSATQNLGLAYSGSHVTQLTFTGAASGTYQYARDSMQRISSVTLDATPARTITRNGLGDVTLYGPFTYERLGPVGAPSKVSDTTFSMTYGFDARGRETRRTLVVAGTTLYDDVMTFDAAGRASSHVETISGVARTYVHGYDLDGQLQSVTRDGSPWEAYTYDANGNRLTRTDDASNVETSTYNSRDAQETRGAVTYTFDPAGFLTGQGTNTYDYGTHGELLGATAGGGAITYAYDGYGRRTARTDSSGTTQYLYGDPDNHLAITDARDPAGVLTTFYYDGAFRLVAIVRAGLRYYVATDGLGTPRIVVDGSGAIVKRIERDAYGRLISDTAPGFFLPIGFAGGLEDPATGLVRFGARDYDPMTGRFTARDPLLHESNELNLFVYADNAPTSMRDPRGLWSVSFGACAGGCFDFKVSWDSDTGRWGYCSGVGVGTPQASLGVNPLGTIDPTGLYATAQASARIGDYSLEAQAKVNTSECDRKADAKLKAKDNKRQGLDSKGEISKGLSMSPNPLSAKAVAGACAAF